MKKTASLLMIALSLIIVPLVHADDAYIDDYGTLLAKYVKVGNKQSIKAALVDYQSWGQDPLHKKALSALQQDNPKKRSGKDKMAFWINAYNLLTIDLIIKTGEKESIKNQGTLFKNVWKSHDWDIHGQRYTLDEIEHQILRPMGDPRIHVAINCASLSCPDLYAKPYLAKKLDAQLDQQTKLLLDNATKGFVVNNTGITLSKIFKWFAEDFGDEAGVRKFIGHYLPKTNGKAIDGYLDYNWNLNTQ